MEGVLVVLLTAVFVFSLMKAAFGFLAWLYPESDEYYRSNLDSFFEALGKHTLFELGIGVLDRLHDAARRLISNPLKAVAVFAALSFVLNVVVFGLSSMDVISSYFFFDDWGFEDLLVSIDRAGWLPFLAMILAVGALGTLFDLVSLYATLVLLRWARRSKSAMTLTFHLALDVVLAILACLWAYGILDMVIRVFYDELLLNVSEYADDTSRYLRPTLGETLEVVDGLWYVVIWVGISASLPTIVYLLVLLPIMFLRAVPGVVQRGLSRVVYLMTKDTQPVLKQIAIFSSNLGGLIGAIVAWVRLPP